MHASGQVLNTLDSDRIPMHLHKNSLVLIPLKDADEASLVELASEKSIWEYASVPFYIASVFKEKWFAKAVKQVQEGSRVCFTIFYEGKMVGSSSYYDIDRENQTMKIGYTWFHPSVWGTTINALSKLILFEQAFEKMDFNRVGFSVDSTNQRSCRALEKLGIVREGILRNDMVLPNGRVRDSVIFSVIQEEWFDVKNRILERVGQV